MPAPKNEVTISPPLDMAEAWDQWRIQIPEEERIRVAELVAEASLDSRPGVIAFAKTVLVETFKGTLSPVVLQAAKPWLEMVIFMIDSMNAAAGTNGTASDTTAFLAELRNSVRPVTPVYMVAQLPGPHVVENEPERERLKADG